MLLGILPADALDAAHREGIIEKSARPLERSAIVASKGTDESSLTENSRCGTGRGSASKDGAERLEIASRMFEGARRMLINVLRSDQF